MNGNLIAAIALFGPGTIATPAVAIAMWRTRRTTDLLAAVAAEHRAAHTTAPADAGTTPDGDGQPQPDTEPLAPVIPLTRRAA